MEMQDEDARGQAEFWQLTLAFADSLTLKCAVELGIPQLIHAKGQPLTLSEIITSLQAPSPDSWCLSRVMRFLVKKRVFSEEVKEGEAYYGLTRASKWLVRPGTSGLAPMLTMLNHPIFLAPWQCLSQCVVEGGNAFEKAHGSKIFKYALNNPGSNEIFNEAMASDARVVLDALLSQYKSGFAGLTSLVDVGGGTGTAVIAIVKAHPHISGINFDLPHVVSSAPEHPGVVNVSGDMFISIPHADAVFMKWILHDWKDEDCVKILKQCRKALPSKSGKLIIVDVVLHLKEDTSAFADSRLAFDMLMFAVTSGGLERTEEEWRALLSKGGFSNCNIKPLPTLQSIIEAYPDPKE
ncbi:hypothetical protein AMTR_s00003p00247710 [Amborella trichopoda]|uniref:O-methyltransferase domain-containing protein n=1 Tax=Amborella trichopoda TaxID=13333 RepID=W1P8Q1_AMBTC|nr:hypothetical protein AMTR_s00003p00247710 [Amborella trichopoda]